MSDLNLRIATHLANRTGSGIWAAIAADLLREVVEGEKPPTSETVGTAAATTTQIDPVMAVESKDDPRPARQKKKSKKKGRSKK